MKQFFKTLYRGWMTFAHFMGRINTAILLTVFYFLFLGVARTVVFLLRKDPLDERWQDRPSYWKKREKLQCTKEAFLKPY